MACSIMVSERQRHGKRRNRLDLSNGMRLTPLTNVTDESRTMLRTGLTTGAGLRRRSHHRVVGLAALPFAFLRQSVFLRHTRPGTGLLSYE
ncbi:MAG: hypothetical protein ACTS8S_17160, partial [Giesbergeria sp.]